MAMEVLLDWRSLGSLLATVLVMRTALLQFLPPEVRGFICSRFSRLLSLLHPTATVIIDEVEGSRGSTNELFELAQLYLSSHCLANSPDVRLHKSRHSPGLVASLPDNCSVVDCFQGIPLEWTLHTNRRNSNSGFNPYGLTLSSGGGGSDTHSLTIRFRRRHRDVVLGLYIPHVRHEAKLIRLKERERKLYTNRATGRHDDHNLWSQHAFSHPSTFETLAIDPVLKEEICADLLRFTERREYYARLGRAWKRGYMLFGPPGTGKTSMVAAIANLLEFDIYNLDLTAVRSNSHLCRLIQATTAKSIIVIEDVDCSLDLMDRKRKKNRDDATQDEQPQAHQEAAACLRETISLSGMLNSTDGLDSAFLEERLMVFTTNHPERLDAALVRPGRVDKKFELGYCRAGAFRVLVKNYLGNGQDDWEEKEGKMLTNLMAEAEELLGEVQITPAEVAEIFMGSDSAGAKAAVGKVVEELRRRKERSPPPQESVVNELESA